MTRIMTTLVVCSLAAIAPGIADSQTASSQSSCIVRVDTGELQASIDDSVACQPRLLESRSRDHIPDVWRRGPAEELTETVVDPLAHWTLDGVLP